MFLNEMKRVNFLWNSSIKPVSWALSVCLIRKNMAVRDLVIWICAFSRRSFQGRCFLWYCFFCNNFSLCRQCLELWCDRRTEESFPFRSPFRKGIGLFWPDRAQCRIWCRRLYYNSCQRWWWICHQCFEMLQYQWTSCKIPVSSVQDGWTGS